MIIPDKFSEFVPWLVGGPGRVLRRWLGNIDFFFTQLSESRGLRERSPMPGTPNYDYFKKYYNGDKIGVAVPSILFIFDGSLIHGGLTDRLRGILSSYSEAKKRGIPLYIHWTVPFRLETYLEPAEVDWRISPDKISRSREEAFPVLIEDLNNLYSGMRLRAALKGDSKQLHLFSNSATSKGSYAPLYHELFRPTPLLAEAIRRHAAQLGSKYRAFSFRFISLMGDFKDCVDCELPKAEREELIARNLHELESQLNQLPEGYKALVASDSPIFLERVKTLDERIYVVPGGVMHVDYTDGADHPDIWLKTFVDQQLLMGAERVTLMRTGRMYCSGFPSFAAEVGGAEFIDHQF